MASILSEVEQPAIQEKDFAGPSNPMSQHAYEGFAKRQSHSGSGSGLFLGAAAIGLLLVLASIFGLWLLRSVRRLNRQVAHLDRQAEQFNRRIQGTEQQAKALDQKISQAATEAQAATAAQTAATRGNQTKTVQETPAAPAQPAPQGAAAERGSNPVEPKAEEVRNPREEKLSTLQQSLGQIAETHRTAAGLVTTLGEKSLRFDSGKSDIAPQYRGVLNRIAGFLKPMKGYSINIYGYTDDSGTNAYNLTLSARRARAVRDALVKAGIDPSLVSSKGFGKSKPLVPGSTAKARATNRRVEIGIVASTPVSARLANSSKAKTNQ